MINWDFSDLSHSIRFKICDYNLQIVVVILWNVEFYNFSSKYVIFIYKNWPDLQMCFTTVSLLTLWDYATSL